jgi:transcriptional regulator with XRE-family HTH domain
MDVVKTFSDRLRYARRLRGITQKALARAGGLSQSAIASYESGQRQSSRALFKLASALKVSPNWLDTGRGAMDVVDQYLQGPLEQDHTLMDPLMRPGRSRPVPVTSTLSSFVLARADLLSTRERRMLEIMISSFVDACQHEKTRLLK